MPTTRSASKRNIESGTSQHDGDDVKHPQPTANDDTNHEANTSRKRKQAADMKSSNSKRKKPESTNEKAKSATSPATSQGPILINRSPVLQLWGASVAQSTHPELSWTTCLSIGDSIATLCAVSKGRAIGKVAPKDDTSAAEQEDDTPTDSDHLQVMGFPMDIQDGVVVVNGKPKPVKEDLLQKKFGESERYESVKQTMKTALESWRNSADELNGKAFHMYEQFRPNVAGGSSGWGRKGELKLDKIKSVVGK